MPTKIIHQIEKKKIYSPMLIFIALFSSIGIGIFFIFDVVLGLGYGEKYIGMFIGLFILIFMVTRKDNEELFQAYEYEEVKHKIR